MSAPSGSTPSSFYDELGHSTPVQRALEALGDAPRGWIKAASAARAAEWKVRSSFPEVYVTTLAQARDSAADDVSAAQGRLANAASPRVRAELEIFVANCEQLLAAAQSLLDACPQEAKRIAAHRERDQHRRALQLCREEVNRHQAQGFQPPTEVWERYIDLRETVEADERQAADDLVARHAMETEAHELRAAAVTILVGALQDKIHDAGQAIKDLLTRRQLAIITEYPSMADPAIMRHRVNAQGFAKRIADLIPAAPRLDVDATLAMALTADQRRAFLTLAFPLASKLGAIAKGHPSSPKQST